MKILQILQGQSVFSYLLISRLKPSRDFLFRISEDMMLTQYHYKYYELDFQKIVKYALAYNGNCFFVRKLHSLFLETYQKKFVHFNS